MYRFDLEYRKYDLLKTFQEICHPELEPKTVSNETLNPWFKKIALLFFLATGIYIE